MLSEVQCLQAEISQRGGLGLYRRNGEQMKKLYTYLPESEDLKQARVLEQASSWQTVREAESDRADLIKDRCALSGLGDDILAESCIRRGVPESYSHLYDAPRPA